MIESFERIEHREERPYGDEMAPGVLYLCEHAGGQPYFLWFRCPCGCGAERALYLGANGQPRWDVAEHDGLLTVTPSIAVTVGCMIHFFIRDNRVVWA